ncbi:Sucrose-phosphate synthase [Handroanthus impetiginosus]|uniref:Sucrose-phosphate synthase n=1 Tax=Handroanthus impetiginosus TaxID=429701 RepID=A0A2G9H5C7_9LAMI|nr:Sucrose-phosphate synthase [Handroanthus impetiginosus]
MRIQALRCHVIYCQNGSKINVIPGISLPSSQIASDCFMIVECYVFNLG